MSKIDEILRKPCLGWTTMTGKENFYSEEQLESLRPYIELGELFVENVGMHNTFNLIDGANLDNLESRYSENKIKMFTLIQQIKEIK